MGEGEKEKHVTYFYRGERCIGVGACNWPGAAMEMRLALASGKLPGRSEAEKSVEGWVEALSS